MANFIKKMVDRAKSRSKSPVKHRSNNNKQWNATQERQLYGYPIYPTYDCGNEYSYGGYYPCSNSSDFHRKDSFITSTHIPLSNISSSPTSPRFQHLKSMRTPNNAGNYNEESHHHPWNAISIDTSPHSTTSHHSHHSETAETFKEPIISMPASPKQGMESLVSRVQCSNSPIASIKENNDIGMEKRHFTRPRSSSTFRTLRTSPDQALKKSRSKSPIKKPLQILHTLDYLLPQCQNEGCSASLIVQDTKFLVCKHQLSHASDYFRALFMANKSIPISGACQSSCNEFAIIVSSFTHPPPTTQFKWFLESAIQAPVLRDITDDTLETCMRLSKRFRAKGLEMRCARYIQDNVSKKAPTVALCWLNWVLKHKFDRKTHDACLPCVAAASLQYLEEHRNMITEKLLADLLAAKLRTLYDQVVDVFQTIHRMDHFFVDLDKCPRCGCHKEQEKIRVEASPCRKLLGCKRCLEEYGCNLSGKKSRDFQAYYQCQHGLIPLNDHTADCPCQIPTIASHLVCLGPQLLPISDHR